MTESSDDTTGPDSDAPARQVLGPLAYRNWHAMLRNEHGDSVRGFEVLLYGDAHAVGGHWDVGPYEIVNTISSIAKDMGATTPPIALRVWSYLSHNDWMQPPLTATDTSSFVGTGLADEIAVLLALLTARRLRAGGTTRAFDNRREPGTPRSDIGIAAPIVPPPGRRLLPRQAEQCNLVEPHLELLKSYVELPADRAVALARAARAYRDAIWLGESQPELAWLLLVSAVECVANTTARNAYKSPMDLLRASRRSLAKILMRPEISSDWREKVAKEIAHTFKATDKFVSFMLHFGPKAGPDPRPPQFFEFKWHDEEACRTAFELIYEHRSRALHEAIAIPAPMLEPPRNWGVNTGFDEVLYSGGMGALGGAWLRKDIPMLLQAFEFAVQNALVSWWKHESKTHADQTTL